MLFNNFSFSVIVKALVDGLFSESSGGGNVIPPPPSGLFLLDNSTVDLFDNTGVPLIDNN